MDFVQDSSLNYREEIIRKMIHLASLGMPIVYYFITRQQAIWILSGMIAFALTLDFGRYLSPSLSKVFYSVFGFLLRKHEKDSKKRNLNGATYVLLSAMVCVLLFPKYFFLTAFPIFIISDGMAALVGRKYGRHKFLLKSFEGTSAFFISAVIVVLLTPKITAGPVEVCIGIIAAFVGAIVENISYGWADDNFSIPISVSLTMWGLFAWLLPQVNPEHFPVK